MTKTPMIGSYRKQTEMPEKIEIGKKAPEEKTPIQEVVSHVEEEMEASVNAAKEVVEKAESYEEILSKADISINKAHAIVDSMLEKGFYEETLPVTKNTSVTFRTRTHNDYLRYLRALELYTPKYVEEQNELQIRYFLASSLVSFKGKVFSHTVNTSNAEEDRKSFDTRLDWIESQPERVTALLASKLSKFDEVVHTVMSEGVVENF